ncbi:unnamed protein product [Blepharisma stoltei]|uniref:V-type proton ATPase subunit a n=1 Tax=Blepharisma stoltei TaxID=1481888 RepID=A0AAU9JQA5_9CILI|nr:unnamed protein product [Blepharisma stoltei]
MLLTYNCQNTKSIKIRGANNKMGLMRSETMGYYTLIMQADMGWRILNHLGKLSVLQFVDLNSNQIIFNRRYASYIRRCEEAERRIRLIMTELERFNIKITYPKNAHEVLDQLDNELEVTNTPAQAIFENLESDLEKIEKSLNNQIRNYEDFQSHFNGLIEKRLVLKQAKSVFGIEGQFSIFKKIGGIIDKADIIRFKKMILRTTRGNTLDLFYDIEELIKDPKTNKNIEKSVFFILYKGDDQSAMSQRLAKVCDTVGCKRYDIPADQEQIAADFMHNENEINTNIEVSSRTKENILTILERMAAPRNSETDCSYIEEQRLFVLKEKAIYHNLNMFNLKNNIFCGNCWCPKSQEQKIINILDEMAKTPGTVPGQLREAENPPENDTPPTYFRLNDFTAPFQEIVNLYGVPCYQEANPAFFTCVTFPFLFGIMFGDIGHGLLWVLFACYLIYSRKSIEKSESLFKPAIPARYLFLLMGLFATYCGFIYNDFLGVPLNLFGSRWSENPKYGQYTQDSIYPIGLDPSWYRADNELAFFNSFKMKISVIFGVIQMIAGNMFRGANAIYFKNRTNFFFEFIPQLVFMVCIFGYMILMIFIKWVTDWRYNWDNTAPNIITILMNMILKFGSLSESQPLWGDKQGQEDLQFYLLSIALICVPLMLIPKPFILKHVHEQEEKENSKKTAHSAGYVEIGEDDRPIVKKHSEHKKFDLSEELINQMIETIEYVLGAISNTASYLRLWALSLAHGQLAKVFFKMCLIGSIESGLVPIIFIGFLVFANVTVGVLMMMDAMECSLHTLRLHWVEFQSKFYKGEGIKFDPFSFQAIIAKSKR